MAKDVPLSVLTDVALIECGDAITWEPGPIAYGLGSRLVFNHAQRQAVALQIPAVAITPDTHGYVCSFFPNF